MNSIVTQISMIGLGAMGGALARAMVGAGHAVTVWNRDAAKMEPFRDLGARCAGSFAEAVQASPVIMVCLDRYSTTFSLFGAADVLPHLTGKTVVQLGTGSPDEAREAQGWFEAGGAQYLDGANMGTPGEVGGEKARMLFAGKHEVYERCLPLLRCLGGDLRHVGENASAAATLDMSLLMVDELCAYAGVFHSVLLCRSEKIAIDHLAMLLGEDRYAGKMARIIHDGGKPGMGATINVWSAVVEGMLRQARKAGINGEVPTFIAGLFRRAQAQGLGNEDVAELLQVFGGSGMEKKPAE